jgi:predicted nucleic acid-binding protein
MSLDELVSASARLLDTGIWVGLAFASHPQHRLAREMFEAADSERPVAFCRATQNSFLRLLTTPAIEALYGGPAVTNAQAWAKSQELLALPQVVWLAEPVALESEWKRCACVATVSPKVWMAASIAVDVDGVSPSTPLGRVVGGVGYPGFRYTPPWAIPVRRVAARAWGGRFPGYACGRLCCWRRARVKRPRERTSPAGIQVLASGMVRVPGPEV